MFVSAITEFVVSSSGDVCISQYIQPLVYLEMFVSANTDMGMISAQFALNRQG